LRPATDSDDSFLFEVYASTRTEELLTTGWTEDQKQAFLAMQFHAQRSDYTERFPNSELSIVVVDGADAGRLWVDRSADEIRILDIALLPYQRNRGIGTSLLNELIREAQAATAALRHAVYATNERAQRLYRRLGFTVVEDFATYVLMEWSEGPPESDPGP